PIFLIAQRYSMATFLPSTNPASFRPCRKGSTIYAKPVAGVLLRNPTTGIAGCCARAASGHAATAPPSAAINSRRPMVTGNVSPSCEAVCLVNDTTDVLYKRTIRLSARHLLARQHGPGRE